MTIKMMTTSAMNVAMCISVIMMMMMMVSTMNAATECISVRDVPIWLCPVQELCAVPIEPVTSSSSVSYNRYAGDHHCGET